MQQIQKVVKIGVVQMTATANIEQNFEFCKQQIEKAATEQAEMVFFPECFYYFPEKSIDHCTFAKPFENNPDLMLFQQLAIKHKMWLSLGGFQIKGEEKKEEKMQNTHIIINKNGETVSRYVKMHLFDVDIDPTNQIRESNFSIGGDKFPQIVQTPIGNLGLSICYDIRFPELFREQAIEGATVFANPAAFLKTTGEAHWHILQRARAIENSSYVIASAQVGSPFQGRELFGHSLVVDPWGQILLDMEQQIGIGFVDIDLYKVNQVRNRLPSLKNRRTDLYSHSIKL